MLAAEDVSLDVLLNALLNASLKESHGVRQGTSDTMIE